MFAHTDVQLRCELSDFHWARSGVCAACSTPTKLLLVPTFLKPSLLSWYHPQNQLLFSPQSPLPTYSGLTPAETLTTGHRAFSFSPASNLHVSLPLLVWQCSTVRPRIAKRILGKKGKAKSITWLQSTHCKGGAKKIEEFKASQGSMRGSLKNKSINAQNFTSACLLQCYSYLKSMVLTEKQTPRLHTE